MIIYIKNLVRRIKRLFIKPDALFVIPDNYYIREFCNDGIVSMEAFDKLDDEQRNKFLNAFKRNLFLDIGNELSKHIKVIEEPSIVNYNQIKYKVRVKVLLKKD